MFVLPWGRNWGWSMYCPYCAVDYTAEEPCFCYPPPPVKPASAPAPQARGPWGEASEAWSSESDLTTELATEPLTVGACLCHSPPQQIPASRVKGPWGEAAAAWSFEAPASPEFPEPLRVGACVREPRPVKGTAVSTRKVEGPWGEAAPVWSLGPDVTTEPLPEPLTVGACSHMRLPLKRTCIVAVPVIVPWGEAEQTWSLESDVTTETVTEPP
jgi:hypothetical protein